MLAAGLAQACSVAPAVEPDAARASGAAPSVESDVSRLFDTETFGGNGRTCETCHSKATGTLSPADVEALYAADPRAPLFRPIDSDDGIGTSYARLRERATVRVHIPLPPNMVLVDDPTAKEVVVERGIPTTKNVALGELFPNEDGRSVLMYDLRQASLEDQAAAALRDHAEVDEVPPSEALTRLADFERQDPRFYSSPAIRRWAIDGGEAPTLPEAHTPAEQRGRAFFEEGGRCESCHSGPLLNQTTAAEIQPVGAQWATAFAGELLPGQSPQPMREWELLYEPGEVPVDKCEEFFGTADQEAGSCRVWIPDPLRMLITGDLDDFGAVKIPTLWGINQTAPYFHDNSARDLEAVLLQYDAYFTEFGSGPLPASDQADIIAFLKLL